MGRGRRLWIVLSVSLAGAPFACTQSDDVLPSASNDASTDGGAPLPGEDAASAADGTVSMPDAAPDVSFADAGDASVPIDASDGSVAADAADATGGDASDSSIPDAADAALGDEDDGAPTDASDASPDDASDASTPDAADAGACGFNPLASSWDVTADFSTTLNPCGVWTYGYTTSLGSTPLIVYSTLQGTSWVDPSNVTSGTPTVWQNQSGTSQNGVGPGQVSEHPGPHGEYSTSRWTAPRAGSYSIAAQFFTGDVGQTDGAILHGTTVLFESATSGSPSYATTLTMSAGDTVDIAVGITGGETFNFGNTPVTLVVTDVAAEDGG